MKTIDEAVEYAAKNLPENAVVNIKIEKDGYAVELEVSDGNGLTEVIDMNEDSIVQDVKTATDEAPEYQGA